MTQFKTSSRNTVGRICGFVLMLLCLHQLAFSQVGTPSYYSTLGTGSANTFPLNTTSSNKIQWIYAPNNFSSGGGGVGTPAPASHLITKVFIRFSGTVNAVNTYQNLEVSLGQNLGSISSYPQAPASTGVNFYTGLTSCFFQASGFQFTGITANSWYGITLQTPFLYDPSLALQVEVKCSNTSSGGNSVLNVTTTAVSQRFYGGYASPTGTVNTGITPFGFDMIPASVCTAPPTPGTATGSVSTACSGSPFNLGLTGNSAGSGQTYIWQSGPTSSGPWTSISTAAPTPALTYAATTSEYYQCEVTCSGQSTYSTPVLVNIPALFPGGSYTIDKTQPATATNFISFADAISAMACGIAGPVVFDVVTGTGPYTEQVLIPSTVNANATNTVTINGNGNLLTVPANSTNLYTLGLNGADYFTFNDLIVEGTDPTNALVCHLWGNADNNSFNNCTFQCSTSATATTTSPFSVSGSPTSAAATGSSGSNNVLTGCTTIGGYYSLVFYGNSTAANVGNKAINCTAQDMYLYGIYALYQNGWEVSGCTVERVARSTVSTTYGIYASTGVTTALIHDNKVRKLFDLATTSTSSCYAIYIGVDATSGNEHQVYNNLVYDIKSNGLLAGIYAVGIDYIKIYHNTVSLDYTASTSTSACYGIYATGTLGGIDIKNNLVSISRGGTGAKYCLYYGTLPTSDNNALWMASTGGTTNAIGYNGTAYATLAAWIAGSGKDAASVSADPLYVNVALEDYTPSSSNINNVGSPVGVANDINGLVRSATNPDPGAIEYNLASTDMTILSVSAPALVGCFSSSEQVTAIIKNAGTDPIDFSLNPSTITVNYNGPLSFSATETLTSGSLAVGATMSVNLNPAIDLTNNGTYVVTGDIITTGDGNPSNDNLTSFNLEVYIQPGTIVSDLNSPICVSNTPTFTLSGQFGGTKQWQISTVSATGPWTNVGTGTNTYSPGIQTADYWIQVESNCNSNYAYTNVIGMVVNNPALVSTTPGTRCGTGTVNLDATPAGSANVNWYDVPTGGTSVGTGNTFTTPTISSTTTYYAAPAFGSGTLTVPGGNTWNQYTTAGSFQTTLITGAVMIFSTSVPLTISALDIYPSAAIGTAFTIQVRQTSGSGAIIASYSGTTTVQNSGTPSIAQTVPCNLVIPAGSNYVIGFSGTNPNCWRGNVTNFPYPFTLPGYLTITGASASGTSASPTLIYQYYLYNWKVDAGCEGPRVPVVATVNTAPALTINASTLAPCPGSGVDLSVSSSNDPDYTYTWTAVPAGFTATGAGPHNDIPAVTTTYNVAAEDLTVGPNAGCTAFASVTVNAAATLSGGTVTGNFASICNNEQSTLTVTGASGGTIQWQSSSSPSGPWTNVGTPGSTTHPTGPLSQTTYYQVEVICQTTSVVSNTYTVTVNNPSIATTTPGTRCGIGPVTLNATPTNVTDNIYWYNAPTGGSQVASGQNYTPTVAATTTYYAAAATGGGAGLTGAIPLANGTTTGTYHHMFMITSPTGMTINNIGLKVNDAIGVNGTWNVYYRPDNYQTIPGANTSSAGWILLSNATVASLGNTAYTNISTGNSLTIPAGATYSFHISPVSGTHQYATTVLGTTNSINPNVTFVAGHRGGTAFNCATSGGQAVVRLEYSVGCEGTRVPVTATVTPAPSITITGSNGVCIGDPTAISATSSNPDYTYTWMPGNITGATPNFTPSAITTYTVTGQDLTAGIYAGCAEQTTVTINPIPKPSFYATSATPSSVNPGCSTTLQTTTLVPASNVPLGTAVTTSVAAGIIPYNSNWEGSHVQYLLRASELNAIGINNMASLSSIGFDVTALGAGTVAQSNFTIKMAHTTQTALTGYATTIAPLQTVYGPVSLGLPALGVNTITLTTPFEWDGISNVVIDICHDNDLNNTCAGCFSSSSTVKYTATSFNSVYGTYGDNVPACGVTSTTVVTSTFRPNMIFGGTLGQAATITWDPGSIPGNSISVIPAATTVYSVTAVNSITGCTNTTTLSVTVNPDATITGLAASYNLTDPAVTMTGNPAGGVFSGPGVTGSTFDPAAAGVGTHTITYMPTGYCVPATATVIVVNPTVTLDVRCFIQGYYTGSLTMNPALSLSGLPNPATECDNIIVELHDATTPYATAYTYNGTLMVDGMINCTFPGAALGNPYYIVIRHRNALETWSNAPITMAATNTYNFHTAATQAFGGNQIEVEPGVWALYSGDIDPQDLSIDGFDYVVLDPDVIAGTFGYVATDLTGDGLVDAFDYLILDPNITAGITVITP
jgi:hypothetical protein